MKVFKRVVIEKNKKVYYILPNGKKSKVFDEGREFTEGYAAVRKGKKWFFMDENGKLSKDSYSYAVDYCCGYAVVNCQDGKDRYRNRKGILSEESFDRAYGFTDSGFAVVEKNGKEYLFTGTSLSESFAKVSSINEGYATVKNFLEDGTAEKEWRYLNLDTWQLSEDSFQFVYPVENGFSKVACAGDSHQLRIRRAEDGMLSEESFTLVENFKKDEEFARVNTGEVYYIDKDLTLWKDDKYLKAGEYQNGFAQVYFHENVIRFRDMLGRHSDNKTKSGEDFYKYYNGGISINKLSALHFIDKRFCDGILRIERRKIEERARAIHNSDLDNKTKKQKYAALVEEMNVIKKTVSEKQSKGILMDKNAREADAKRREAERKRKAEIKEDKQAYNELLDSLK